MGDDRIAIEHLTAKVERLTKQIGSQDRAMEKVRVQRDEAEKAARQASMNAEGWRYRAMQAENKLKSLGIPVET